jgi:polysaccharide pyruvyl transferase WcaK-like protein
MNEKIIFYNEGYGRLKQPLFRIEKGIFDALEKKYVRDLGSVSLGMILTNVILAKDDSICCLYRAE